MRSRLLLAVGAALLTGSMTSWRPSILIDLDHRVYDALIAAGAAPASGVHAAIVAIDEPSLERYGQWPWPRALLASLVDRLHRLGASAIALDLLLAEPDRTSAEGDSALAGALARTRAIPAFALLFEDPVAGRRCEVEPLNVVVRQAASAAPELSIFEALGAICPVPELARAAPAAGFINAAPDADGRLRRAPLVARLNGRIHPSLALALVGQATGGRPVGLSPRADGSLMVTVGGRSFGLDAQGRMLIRTSRPLAARPVLSAADVLDDRVAAGLFEGRVVFVGGTAAGLRDAVTIPVAGDVPGVVAHASMAETLLGAPGYERPEFADVSELASAMASAAMAALVSTQTGWMPAVFALSATALATWWLSRWLLAGAGLWVSPFWALVGLSIGLVLGVIVVYGRQRRRADRERDRRANAQRLIVQALTTLTETRDVDTGRHARRTQAYTRVLATALARMPAHAHELPPERIELIATLAPLHDIGKVGVPDTILRKPGALTPEEFREMRRHPGIGHDSLLRAEALAGVHDDDVLSLAKEIVYTHHERWDGAGYPRGLRGSEIPVSGRLVALVDAYDALVVDRTYRDALPHDQAVATIVEGRGAHFDPDVVDAFLAVHEEFRQLRQEEGLRF